MNPAQSVALAFLVTQNETESNIAEQLRLAREENERLRASQPVKSSKVKAKKAPTHQPPAVTGMMLGLGGVERGSLTAGQFMVTVRKATSREETIQAIHAYCGYNPNENFGAQDTAARAKAQRELSAKPLAAGPSREEQKSAARSMTGFVHGMPDHVQRKLANLRAQAVVYAEALIGHEKAAEDESRTVEARTLSTGLAAFERDRLNAIHADIRAMGFEV